MANENILQNFMDTVMKNIKTMIDIDTIIGTPITSGDTIIVPISKVSFGMGVGGTGIENKKSSSSDTNGFGGGGGGGANVDPVAFLVITGDNVRIINLNQQLSSVDKIMDLVPGMLDKVNNAVSGFTAKRKEKKSAAEGVVVSDTQTE